MRVILDLTEDQLRHLRRVCEREGMSRAEAVRRAIDKTYGASDRPDAESAGSAAFGLWRNRKGDLGYIDRLRAEWDEREQELRQRYRKPAERAAVVGERTKGKSGKKTRTTGRRGRRPE